MDKQVKEFNFHGIKLNGIYNPNLDSWWFKGKDVYRCLNVSHRMMVHYMKQIDDNNKIKLRSDKVDKLFYCTRYVQRFDIDSKNQVKDFVTMYKHMEWLISESGLYRLVACFGNTKECEEFRNWVFNDLLVTIRKVEQKALTGELEKAEDKITYLEAQNAGLNEELKYWRNKVKYAREILTDNRNNPKHKKVDKLQKYDIY